MTQLKGEGLLWHRLHVSPSWQGRHDSVSLPTYIKEVVAEIDQCQLSIGFSFCSLYSIQDSSNWDDSSNIQRGSFLLSFRIFLKIFSQICPEGSLLDD